LLPRLVPGTPSSVSSAPAAWRWSIWPATSGITAGALEEAAAPRDDLRSAPWRFQFALALASRPETRAEGIRWLRYGFDDPLLTPQTYLALGRAHQAAGDRRAAADAYAHFVRLWSRADPPLQAYVREAQAALRDLRD
jgi:hypothetical protein